MRGRSRGCWTIAAALALSLLSARHSAAQIAADSGGRASGSVVDTALIERAVVRTFSELLQARLPGVEVRTTSGTLGAESQIRIRGLSSYYGAPEPLVIVDGLVVEGGAAENGLGFGPRLPSRLDDIDPTNVERIEILRGPATGWMYGAGAERGVVLVTTKRGGGAQDRSVFGDSVVVTTTRGGGGAAPLRVRRRRPRHRP